MCARCPAGQGCGTGADCASGACAGSVCAAASCTDGLRNGVETDIDCGGANACPRCAAGDTCGAATDCSAPLYCHATTRVCTAPTCTDVMRNGSESDVDCGGSCAPAQKCANGRMCLANGDCTSANCASMTCSALGCQNCWKVQYKNFNPGATLWSEQVVNIVSIGTTAVPLSELKVRYWFDADGQTPSSPPTCNSAWMIGCPNITVRFVTPPSPAPAGANRYLEIGFVAGAPTLAAGGQTADIQTSFHYSGFATVNRENDYSFDATKTALTDWTHVALYHNGNKVWGSEP
ncbi:MAG: cellulose binding domain-containing protein [Bacteroidota bacterium]